jgi:hypothetical protein
MHTESETPQDFAVFALVFEEFVRHGPPLGVLVVVMELQEVPMVIVIHVARGGHDIEGGTDPDVIRLAVLIGGWRIPHPLCIDPKPLAKRRHDVRCRTAGVVATVPTVLERWRGGRPARLVKGNERLLGEDHAFLH